MFNLTFLFLFYSVDSDLTFLYQIAPHRLQMKTFHPTQVHQFSFGFLQSFLELFAELGLFLLLLVEEFFLSDSEFDFLVFSDYAFLFIILLV